MINIYNEELIQKFINEELEGDDLVRFKELFKADKEFAKEVKIAMDTIVTLKASAKLKARLNEGLIANYLHKRYVKRVYMLVAASIVVLVSVGTGTIYFINRPLSSQELFASYYKDPEGFQTKGNEQYIPPSPGDTASTGTEDMLNYSIYLIKKEQFNRAIEILNGIVKTAPGVLHDQAQWYLSLCYLKTNQLELAEQQLKLISMSANPHNLEASELLKRMKRVR